MATKRKPTDKVQLKIRLQESLRAKIEKEAEGRDASLNDEIVRRLERSFEPNNILRDVLELGYGPHLAGLLQAIGDAAFRTVAAVHPLLYLGTDIDPAKTTPFNRALVEPWIFDQVARSTMAIIEHLRPPGSTEPPSHVAAVEYAKGAGERWAESLIGIMNDLRAQIREGVPPGPEDDRIQWAVESLADLLRLKEERMDVLQRSTKKLLQLEKKKAAEK
ncbi:hypothetical protein [Reyranella sp.]|jgi:hypothetical protein|uniref:hypothetical protein n=1 Tax=Reyranella sp. TaxID=1929291 RepID=UPI000BD52E93|nr:hypothetical protein [Reyranella sp.]OYY38714.1 MAG: hypothetical protein B7Y57_20590 [Rhodospirillales bacterium 35-66-84]OYZ92258.1 MAG: hypothetical protein B7Y08_22885 [Rhodospirillales bacterium 24-66-33]OZB23662.1 MAG: hypothetical protein B7X63_19145 [Rhodospirillales bacterium 39-66-50]HQS15448.1 hypothetical protein [Reyranella sp.]HQT11974.1 hypothetical protein [Reyranella sp.]